ncbi:unnamed protein product, partial [Coregonus sp. 'balchen']
KTGDADTAPNREERALSLEEEEEGEESQMKGLPSREERQATAEWEPSVEPEVTLESDSCEEPEDHPSPGDRVREKTEERRLRQVRLVEWCTDCGSEPTLTCTTRRHKKLYVCVWSISVNTSSSCSVCGKHCVDEAGLKHHQRLHRQEHVYSCKFCLKPFKALEDKWTHEKNDHRVKRLHYRCSECPQGFYNILKRNRHLREHESKRHICHTCYKEFPQLSKLERHELSHSDNKSF